MRRYLICALLILLVVGCTSSVIKEFKVIADPPDAVIKVVSSSALTDQKYSSPAVIRVEIPVDPALASKATLEVSKVKYKPTIIALKQINSGDTLRIKLEKIIQYEVQCRMIAPVPFNESRFQDSALSIWFNVKEQSFQFTLMNRSNYPLKIIWSKAEYEDIYQRQYRLVHSGISYQNRYNPIPDQIVLPGKALEGAITPIDNIYVSQQTRGYEVKPLFSRENLKSSALPGKTFKLFIPIEINRSIYPYDFKLEIVNVITVNDKD